MLELLAGGARRDAKAHAPYSHFPVGAAIRTGRRHASCRLQCRERQPIRKAGAPRLARSRRWSWPASGEIAEVASSPRRWPASRRAAAAASGCAEFGRPGHAGPSLRCGRHRRDRHARRPAPQGLRAGSKLMDAPSTQMVATALGRDADAGGRLVLGSGLGELADAVEDAVRIPYARSAGLSGLGRLRPRRRAGRSARLAGVPVAPALRPRALLRAGRRRSDAPAAGSADGLGVDTLILTNAAGSLRHRSAPARSC